jgi:tyrosyl-tRNA synthetase
VGQHRRRVDLVRRRSAGPVHAFTWPLLTRADGAKFGKSAGGSVWLDPSETSPYQFFQYWMNSMESLILAQDERWRRA